MLLIFTFYKINNNNTRIISDILHKNNMEYCNNYCRVTGGVVANSRNGPQPVGHVAQPATNCRRRGRLSGRAESSVHRHRRVHHHVGQSDRHVHGIHEPAAAVIVGHHRDVGGDHATRAAVAHHRRHRVHRDLCASLGQGRQRVRRQFQRQRV